MKNPKLRDTVLFKLQMTRWRQKAWRDKPELMESIRQRAVNRAKAIKDEKRKELISYFAEIPEKVTTEELMSLIGDDYCRQREVKKMSFFQHIRNHRFFSYDAVSGLWINNCK